MLRSFAVLELAVLAHAVLAHAVLAQVEDTEWKAGNGVYSSGSDGSDLASQILEKKEAGALSEQKLWRLCEGHFKQCLENEQAWVVDCV